MLEHLFWEYHNLTIYLTIGSFLYLLISFAVNIGALKKFAAGIDYKIWLLLIAVFCLGLYLRLLCPHRHIMFIGEFDYMEAAKNILWRQKLYHYNFSLVWPFILSVFFKIFGVSNHVAIYVSIFLGAAAAVTAFLFVSVVADDAKPGLIYAFIFAILPVHIFWSACAQMETASLFFILLSGFSCFLFYRRMTFRLFCFAVACLTVTAQVRVENCVYFLLFFAGCLLFRVKVERKNRIHYFLQLVLSSILCVPNICSAVYAYASVDNFAINEMGTGANWSLHNFIHNLMNFGPDIFSTKNHPLIFSILMFAGLLYMLKHRRKELCYGGIWFAALAAIYFTSFIQVFQADGQTRFMMYFYPVTSLLVSFGLFGLYNFLKLKTPRPISIAFALLACVVFVWSFVPYVKHFVGAHQDIYKILITDVIEKAERDVPPECVIVTPQPVILRSTTHLNAISTGELLSEKQKYDKFLENGKCILFFEDAYCQYVDMRNSFTECRDIVNEYQMEIFKKYSYDVAENIFWKLTAKKTASHESHLKVVHSLPEKGQDNVPRNPSEFIFYFNRKIDPGMLSRIQINFGKIHLSYRTAVTQNSIIIKPRCYDRYLQRGENYRLTLSGELPGENGPYHLEFEMDFTTGDTVNGQGPPVMRPGEPGYESHCL